MITKHAPILTDYIVCSLLDRYLIPEPTARSAVPGVSPGRGLLIVHKRSSKSLFMGDGDEIFFGRS